MQRLHPLPCAGVARGVLSSTVVLLALALLAGCEPEPTSPEPTPPEPTPPAQTARHNLAAGTQDAEAPAEATAYRGVLDRSSHVGVVDFHYDAFVLTATKSGSVSMRSEVLATEHSYKFGYGYPLTIAPIEDGVMLGQSGGQYVQDALESGTAILEYPVVAGRQYILVYKTFGDFTPLTYRLTLPAALKLEGRIVTLPEPVLLPAPTPGPITVENPHPQALGTFVEALHQRVGQ